MRFLACVAGLLGIVVLTGCAGGTSQPPVATSTVTQTVTVPAPSIEERWQSLAKSVAHYEGNDGIAITRRGRDITGIHVKADDGSYVIVYTVGNISATAFYREAGMKTEKSTVVDASSSYATDEADERDRHLTAMTLLDSIMTRKYGPGWATGK